MEQLVVYGLDPSYYTGKLEGYLRYKEIPYRRVEVSSRVFQHCNLDLRLGPLNWIFSMAELHRWHHSTLIVESNRNYGQELIVWDAVFGTRFLPPGREPPERIGIPDLPRFPTGYLAHLSSVFRWARVKLESRAA